MKHLLRAWVLVCALLVGACSAPVKPDAPQSAVASGTRILSAAEALDASSYRLATGDSVRIDVLGEAELSLVALVDSSGVINYPFLGRIQATNATVRDIEREILAGLRSGYLKNPDVRVGIAQYRPVYVSGQVRQSGAYPYSVGLTVEKAITLAGGVTQFASTRRIYVQRATSPPDQREHVELDSQVLPGDTIVVEERLF